MQIGKVFFAALDGDRVIGSPEGKIIGDTIEEVKEELMAWQIEGKIEMVILTRAEDESLKKTGK